MPQKLLKYITDNYKQNKNILRVEYVYTIDPCS